MDFTWREDLFKRSGTMWREFIVSKIILNLFFVISTPECPKIANTLNVYLHFTFIMKKNG